MLVTDLDGTLLDARARLSPGNRAALERLGAAGVLRVVATGRSLYSAQAVLGPDVPIDVLVFSSGVATARWPSAELIDRHEMPLAEARRAAALLERLGKDFMVHHGAPDTHRFDHTPARHGNADFSRRLARYAGYAEPWSGAVPDDMRVGQLLVIEPPGREAEVVRLRRLLPGLTVVRTTSPLDHASTWIEIFAAHVSKSQSCERLRAARGVDPAAVVAVGNDHNDDDLLAWAARAFVVANGVEDLKSRHTVVAANDEDGFAEVADRVLAECTVHGIPSVPPVE